MSRKIRKVGLVLLIALGAGAVVSPGAQARQFTSAFYPLPVFGESVGFVSLTVQGQTLTCLSELEGEIAASSHAINLAPRFFGCTAFGFINAEVATNGCTFEFTIDNPDNSVHIRCPFTSQITVVASTCTVHIPVQTPTTNSVDYANSEGAVRLTSTISGIHSATTDGFLCPLSSSKETDTSGTLTASFQVDDSLGTFDVG